MPPLDGAMPLLAADGFAASANGNRLTPPLDSPARVASCWSKRTSGQATALMFAEAASVEERGPVSAALENDAMVELV